MAFLFGQSMIAAYGCDHAPQYSHRHSGDHHSNIAIETGLKGAPTFRGSLPRFITSEKWNFVPAVLLSIAFLIWIARSLENPKQTQTPVPLSPTPVAESRGSIVQGGNHIGTTFSLELAQTLDRMPKSCNISAAALLRRPPSPPYYSVEITPIKFATGRSQAAQ